MTQRQIAPSAAVLLCAIAVSGVAAGIRVSPVLWLFMIVVGGIVLHAAANDGKLVENPGIDVPELPPQLREHVRSAFAKLPEGDARRLLLGVVNQARLVFARGDSRFDASEEERLAEHVSGLVDACCTTAGDLARLDEFASDGATGTSARTDLASRAAKARELFRDRLTNAASALAELYTANVERGTPSTDRVAELTAEISSDASARSAATQEMSKLLGPQ